jgi:hypothetical protein
MSSQYKRIGKPIKGWDAKAGIEFDITPKLKSLPELTAKQQGEKLRAMITNMTHSVLWAKSLRSGK